MCECLFVLLGLNIFYSSQNVIKDRAERKAMFIPLSNPTPHLLEYNMFLASLSVLFSRPDKGETRNINVEKSSEPLGIKIDTSNNGGIFVSSVNDNSLARKAGVQIGDQLLEVCYNGCIVCLHCIVLHEQRLRKKSSIHYTNHF